MATTPNVGLDLPDEEKTVADEVRRLAGNLVLLDGLIKALQTLVVQKAAAVHTHALAQIAGLVEELAAKMPADRQFSLADLVDVIGSTNAPAGYIFVKRADGKFEFISSAAAIGTHKHIAADIIDFDDKVTSKFTNLIGGAPAALDTLYELAAALGNDANFATTVNNKIAAAVTAANNANNNANGRLAKSGDVMSGALEIQGDPSLWLHRGGVKRAKWEMGADGHLRFIDQGGTVHFMFQNNGAIWCQEFGYLNQRIEDRAYAHGNERAVAWANDRVANLQYRLVSQGSGRDQSAPAGAVMTGASITYYTQDGQRMPGVSVVWNYPQIYDPVRGWVGFSKQ